MATILLVVGNAGSLTFWDTAFQGRLEAAGHTVTVIDDNTAEPASNTYDGIAVSDSSSGGSVQYGTVAKPGLTSEQPTSWSLGSNVAGVSATQWSVNAVSPQNGGLTGTQTVYSTSLSQQALTPSGTHTVVATRTDGEAVYVTWEPGDSSTGVNAKRCFLRIPNHTSSTLTAAGTTLLDAAISWTFGPSAPIEKSGTDTALGTESGGVTATVDSGETALGTDTGTVSPEGADTAIGTEEGYVAEDFVGGDTGAATESGDTSAVSTSGEDALGTETYGSSAIIDPAADIALGAEEGFIGIPGEDIALATDGHVPPTLVTVTTGEEALGQEGGYVETLFGDLIIGLKAVDRTTGSLIELPDYESLDISRERNSKGAIRFQYPINGQNFELLRESVTDSRDLEFELWTNGTPIGALRGYLQEARGDDVVADDNGEDGSWQFAGSFLEVRADEALVFPQSRGSLITDPDTGEQVWSNPKRELILNADSPGEVMLLLHDQAQDRGAWTDIVVDFTTTLDSKGVPWAGVITARFSPGSTYTQILNKLAELHLAEWAIEWNSTTQQRVLRIWNAEGRGADLTVGPRPVTLRRGRNLLDAPHQWSVRDAVTTMLAAGAEGLYDDETDATALARRARRIEGYTTLQNATDEEALLGWAQAQLAVNAPGLLSISHGIGMLPGEPRPVIAFDIGDWVYSQTGTTTDRLRVVQWTLTVDNARVLSGTVTLNDIIRDAVEKLQERLTAISSGEAVVGTSEPPPDVEDRTPPAAPEGVVASSIAYQDPVQGLGQTLAFVSVGWNVVTTNADGSDSPLVQCAVFVKDKLEDEITNPPGPDDPVLNPATWTWKDCPRIVQDFAAPLRALWVAAGSPADRIAWLTAYIAEESQTPTAAQDVAGYRVRYSYLGLAQVGGLPSSDPFPDEERFYYEATPPEGTSANEYSFGGVEGGSQLRIEVCAFDRVGNQGPWATIAHDSSNDATPPPVPSAPTAKVWFRTLDVTWDGLGSAGEAMPFDFFATRVWIGRGADMTLPPTSAEPVYATQFDPDETAAQFVGTLSTSGTWNIPDLPYGVGWYVRLQSVDYVGNASTGSVIIGPFTAEQLFSDDLRDFIINHPDMIDSSVIRTAHIANAQIINALIADATIQAAKIGTVSAGSITTGTMTATVTVSGSLWTSLDSNATRLGFSAAGLQLYKTNSPGAGSTLVGEWKTSDGSMLVTGTYRSAVSGERIHIDPDGSFRLYPTSGTNYSQISNVAGEAIWRGPLDGSQRSGRVNVNTLGVGINFSAEANLLESIRAEIVVLDRRMRFTAPFVALEVNEQLSNPAGGIHRFQLNHINSSGDPRAYLNYVRDDDHPIWMGNNAGLVFASPAQLQAKLGPNYSSWINVHGNSFVNSSSETVKEDIDDIQAVLDPLETIRQARARKFIHLRAPTRDTRVGVIAEELPEIITNSDSGELSVDLVQQVGVLWGAFNQVLDQEIVSTSATAILDASGFFPPNIFPAGATAEVAVTWDSTPPAVPTGGFVQIHSSFVWAGRVAAWIKTGTTTATGCTVVFKNISGAAFPTSPSNDNTRVSATVIGLGLYTPPYIPPEDA